MIRKTLLVLSLIALFTSCDNDLKIIADWKAVPAVYGILNAQDSVHYIKLNKAFLGQGDVMMMAQEFDSLHFSVDQVGIRLLEKEEDDVPSQNGTNWQTRNTYELEPTNEFVRPEGVFSSPTQTIYKTTAPLNKDFYYSVEVYRKSNDTIIAQTDGLIPILSPLSVINPNTYSPLVILPNSYVPKVQWRSVSGGKMYELSMRFNYMEFPISGESDTLFKSIEINYPSIFSIDTDGGDNMDYPLSYDQFLGFIAANIPEDPTVRRLVVGFDSSPIGTGVSIKHACLDFSLSAAGEDLATYLVLNENSNSLVLDRPEYSNIENGVGILSSRTVKSVNGVKISNQTNDEIAKSEVTKHLNFGYFTLNLITDEIEINYGN
ncbi:hypothetical protein N9I98_03130 [Flavobacteriales bacterium]|jgi:hypothetical protein|nr:hypothetical protein [Flavobacteriales bacterium]